MEKRESYLVSRISKKDFRAHKSMGYTRYVIRTTRCDNVLWLLLTKKGKIGYNVNLRLNRKAIERGKKNGGVPVRGKND